MIPGGKDYNLPEFEPESTLQISPVIDQLYPSVESFLSIALGADKPIMDATFSHIPYECPKDSFYGQEHLLLNLELPQIRLLQIISCDSFTVEARMVRNSPFKHITFLRPSIHCPR